MRIPILIAAFVSALAAEECRVELERVVYPSIAVQARVEGSVVVKVRINAEGVAAPDQTPQIEGHPLLTSTVRDALPNVRWRGCPSGEQTLKFQFNVADPCVGAPPEFKQQAPGVFAVTKAGPLPPCPPVPPKKPEHRSFVSKIRRFFSSPEPHSLGCKVMTCVTCPSNPGPVSPPSTR